ncbi:MAG: argininosuccinate lyase, partial [Clostridia bacterium]|nr:argininosuccinate lyase [Clostridia bacterium]
GKTGRVYGNMAALFTVMKGIPLAYNKDMQEDKEAVFDAVDNAKLCIELFTSMIATMNVKAENLRRAASGGFINATDCADYLVKKGLPFRDAYKVSGRLVAYCIEHKTTLEELSLEEYKAHSPLFEDDVYNAVSLDTCVNTRTVYGGPSKKSTEHQIALVKEYITKGDINE